MLKTMTFYRLSSLVALAAASICGSATAAPDFEREIAPLLVKRCLECHNDREVAGGLELTSRPKAHAGGDSGAVIEPGRIDKSLLIERITSGEMPPVKQGKSQKLPDAEIELLTAWIASGADWPEGRVLDWFEATSDVHGGRDWWSLQPVVSPPVPEPKNSERVANPIDAFILARLEAEDMESAPLADRPALVCRLYFDVIGLPPTVEQTSTFLADESPEAWERVVDQLLASPHYGERWARYWLDLVRFAETYGYERDQEMPYAWRYRDWVVQSLNDDKPYDRFVIEQLAGDEIADRSEQSVVATGFLRLGTWNDEPNDPHEYKYERLEDMVHVTSSAFLGLTVKCARCHDHKFDPILQLDYYRMAAAFWPGAIEPRDRELLGGPSKDELGFENVFGWTDLSANPKPLHLLKKGDPKHPLGEVAPAHLATIPAIHREFELPGEGFKTTQRRLQLARWITDPANPLTARVFVNRLWQHHFGEGLVRSPNNFGFKGDLPTHPQLLDWLSTDFVAGGWKIKRMHKLILMSSTYRQSSLHPKYEAYGGRDSTNLLWWRANRRRLDAEALRDAMLAASGEIDLQLGGPSFKPTISEEALEGLSRKSSAWEASSEQDQLRRSLYIYSKRGLLPPLMTTFDFADTTLPCGQRDVTTSPTQALALLNNSFVHVRSEALARRVVAVAAEDLTEQVQQAWRFALGREPDETEEALTIKHIAAQRARLGDDSEFLALASLCHVLLNSNEFIYID
ncbi:MAG: PSD1 and planctomycete cytochrome C domain-containing protein [Planctomycetota bacterium]|nr:PSD1 and planctomycete cytochrome C domain-containing protein [Planctomycetota bacterium]